MISRLVFIMNLGRDKIGLPRMSRLTRLGMLPSSYGKAVRKLNDKSRSVRSTMALTTSAFRSLSLFLARLNFNRDLTCGLNAGGMAEIELLARESSCFKRHYLDASERNSAQRNEREHLILETES